MDGDAEILDVPRGHSDAGYTASNGVSCISRGERSTSSDCSRLSQAPGSGTRKQSDASSRVKKRRLQQQQRRWIQRQEQYIRNYDYCRTTRCRSIDWLLLQKHPQPSNVKALPPIEIFCTGPLFQWTYCGICTSPNGETNGEI